MAAVINFESVPCQEASILSRETFIPCGKPAEAAVWHSRDNRLYPMCRGCAWHNVKNRSGQLVASKEKLF